MPEYYDRKKSFEPTRIGNQRITRGQDLGHVKCSIQVTMKTAEDQQARLPSMLNAIIYEFNKTASKLEEARFRRPATPDAWSRAFRSPSQLNCTELFDVVRPLLLAFTSTTANGRSYVAEKLNPNALFVLQLFAFHAAIAAVRRTAPALVSHGLEAVALLGGAGDVRDLTFYLAALHHAAEKLKLDTQKLFEDAASFATSLAVKKTMQTFPLRPPETRDLRAFSLRETLSNGEFDIVGDSTQTG